MPLQDQSRLPLFTSVHRPEEPHIDTVQSSVLDPEEVAVLRASKMRNSTVQVFHSYKSNHIPTEPELLMWECVGCKFNPNGQGRERWRLDSQHRAQMAKALSALPEEYRRRTKELSTRKKEQVSIIHDAVAQWQYDNPEETRDHFPNDTLYPWARGKRHTGTVYLLLDAWAKDALTVQQRLKLKETPIVERAVTIKNILMDPDEVIEAGKSYDVFRLPFQVVVLLHDDDISYRPTPALIDGVFHLAWCPLEPGHLVRSLDARQDMTRE
ncbi:uncharacterized protein BDZ99DRAFT_573671 [Mytilinidion resinicola]|uniref:Uncharacterized protein n=1 Tax=Mytilinidion resinicola TaxID=574789 RepID=A0A6A6YEN9_9PEZI|nr:uncharacterized protein BDZ99DRAFT_573671 [Mytilinidion resinicola]KAF2806993.1 hypothetical protein BDZ99DRAFT_573671 [Mytilinidion resinicola]